MPLAGFISEDVLAAVRQAADIVEIISRYVQLKKSGQSFKALCPFHSEKTPSFTVNPERQLFHCFGCGKKGDVFSFVGEHERVDFPEAVRIVAAAVGVSVPETWGQGRRTNTELKTRLYELHRWATGFFAEQLARGPAAAAAREYLAARHFEDEVLKAWGVGFAPDSWEALGSAALKAGYSDRELLAAGLVIPRKEGNGHYDRFRNRVVFPIRDAQGRPIGFGARALGDSEVKYLNSPETPLFNKSRCLYGLDQARDAIVEQSRVLVTEGYTDTLMCHQSGIAWAVATLGTALTSSHVKLLRRYAGQIVLVFDADAAGEAAVDRSLEVFADADIDVRVASVAAGSDPCDFLVAEGSQAFLERIDAARDLFDVKLDLACRTHDLATAAGRASAIDEVLRSVALVTNVAKADLLAQAVARRMQVGLEAVRRRTRDLRRAQRSTREETAPQQSPALDPLERGILAAVLAHSELVPCVTQRVALEDLHDARVRRILEQCIELYDREGEIDPAALSAALGEPELTALVADLVLAPQERAHWEPWLQDCLDRLDDRQRRLRLSQLREQAARASRPDDPDVLAAIFQHHRRRAGAADPLATDGPLP